MPGKITQKHINDALSILDSSRYWTRVIFKSDPQKQKRKIEELDYVSRLVGALWEDNQDYKKQPKLI